MKEKTREEKCSQLAEWIEPFDSLEPGVTDGVFFSKRNAWICVCDYESGDVPTWKPRNFYDSEEASALLLDKMPYALLKHASTGRHRPPYMAWECWPNPTANGNYGHVRHEDRKTAIAESALKFIEGREQCEAADPKTGYYPPEPKKPVEGVTSLLDKQ
jgi:hypothetical protein